MTFLSKNVRVSVKTVNAINENPVSFRKYSAYVLFSIRKDKNEKGNACRLARAFSGLRLLRVADKLLGLVSSGM